MMTRYVMCRGLLAVLGVAACFISGVGVALAADSATHASVRMRVGETRSLGTFGGHDRDCMKSAPPEIRIVRPPTLGTVSEQEDVPYVAKRSLSGTCLGAHLVGTAVRYTATAPGSETMAFDAVFKNGTDHHTVSVTVR